MIPLLGRLHPWEYLTLFVSFVFIFLEGLIRIITLALPSPIINFFYRGSRRLYNHLSSPSVRRSRNTNKVVNHIAQASDFVELCDIFGYYAEEHVVQTKDGYLLGLHRLGWKKGEEYTRVNAGRGSTQKKVVYLHHGLMMNSEVWVCLTEQERCLPFLLVERGYDVWLGNNRGNKYSKKSTTLVPTDPKFWSFSIDQFAFHDIPDSIDYILQTTNQPSLSYIGFSQGTAQAFATLSIHPGLNDKVDVFIALAPAMSPPGLTTGIVDSFIKTSPDVLFLLFGRGSLLGSATMWQAIFYPPIFVRFIDFSLTFLFGWHTKNITPHQKLAAYPHLYSFTSTKSVVHWFQIIRNGKFQMYDDEYQAPWNVSDSGRFYKVTRFPTRNIKTPIVMVYGGSDSLVDIDVMLKELPRHTVVHEIPHYEHLDFLWGEDVATLVFPHVFEALDEFAGKGDIVMPPLGPLQKPGKPFGDAASGNGNNTDDEGDTSSSQMLQKHSENTRLTGNHSVLFDSPSSTQNHRKKPFTIPISSSASNSVDQSHITDATNISSSSRPEGWWSSDEVVGTEPSTPTRKHTQHDGHQSSPESCIDSAKKAPSSNTSSVRKSASKSSLRSFCERGIMVGKASTVGGISKDAVERSGTASRPASAASAGVSELSTGDDARRSQRKKRKD
ncbi:Alpha/beta hydrolase fold-1 [Venturia nashicola]|uniref:Alpha/beta hydrolase fold-1 n=1 Tax=Venturia nashicola TaxID=86259 RepID=A0A4Z1PUX9_9PEZI|nr:Alpha/beta hydrolase fold-1 [Venturia nashicola]TLD38994.1 Alpha/beta hydrolase fold-1 [Venturia nashicola]